MQAHLRPWLWSLPHAEGKGGREGEVPVPEDLSQHRESHGFARCTFAPSARLTDIFALLPRRRCAQDPVAVPPRAFTHAELAQALLPNALPPLPLPLPSPTPVPVPAAAPAPTPNPVPVQPALIFGETSSSSWSSDDDAEPPTMAEWEADDRERGRLVSEEDARLAGVAAAKGPEQGGEVLVKPEQEEEVEIEAGNVSCVSSAISSGDSGYESGGAVESV